MKQTVLVTGASGFIGGHLAAQLTASGASVRRATRDPATFNAVAMAGVSTVVHLAARVHIVRETAGDPLGAFRLANVELTKEVATAAAHAGVRRFILASTVKAVGESSVDPWTEAIVPRPVDPYGISKLEAEREVEHIARTAGMGSVALRLPLVYGPGVGANFRRLMAVIDRGVPLPFALVANRRSLAYVGNVVAAVQALSQADLSPGEVYFLSDGEDLSTPALITRMAMAMHTRARLFPLPSALLRLLGRAADLDRLLGSLAVDSSALWRRIGSGPAYTVDAGLRHTAEWFRSPKAS